MTPRSTNDTVALLVEQLRLSHQAHRQVRFLIVERGRCWEQSDEQHALQLIDAVLSDADQIQIKSESHR